MKMGIAEVRCPALPSIRSASSGPLLRQVQLPRLPPFVWLPQLLRDELAAYHVRSEWTEPDDFIFTARRGIPMNANNYLGESSNPDAKP